jgi:hypothetical protein
LFILLKHLIEVIKEAVFVNTHAFKSADQFGKAFNELKDEINKLTSKIGNGIYLGIRLMFHRCLLYRKPRQIMQRASFELMRFGGHL